MFAPGFRVWSMTALSVWIALMDPGIGQAQTRCTETLNPHRQSGGRIPPYGRAHGTWEAGVVGATVPPGWYMPGV
jgi:hypothetical protein